MNETKRHTSGRAGTKQQNIILKSLCLVILWGKVWDRAIEFWLMRACMAAIISYNRDPNTLHRVKENDKRTLVACWKPYDVFPFIQSVCLFFNMWSVGQWPFMFLHTFLQQCTYNNNVLTTMYLQQCTHNNVLTTIYLQQRTYNNVLATIYLQQCTYNNILTTMYVQKCIHNNVLTTVCPKPVRTYVELRCCRNACRNIKG
jgi:hypothetical protein